MKHSVDINPQKLERRTVMSQQVGIAGVQMEVVDGRDNLSRMEHYLATISMDHPDVELVVFGELCNTGIDPRWVENIPGEITAELCRLARRYGKWLVPGSLYEKTDGGYYNSTPVINPEGEIVTIYRKIFTWRPREQSLSGERFCIFDIPGKMRFGLIICYDLWFPEMVRQLTWMGAEAILCPTMTGTPDRPQEVILSQACAITNQVYFAGINNLGRGGNGQSIIVGPEGQILDKGEEKEIILTARLDPERVRNARENGTMGQCQALKRFRDSSISFPVYHRPAEDKAGFGNLGPIKSSVIEKDGL